MAEGRERNNWAHTSTLMALIANVNRDPKKTRAYKPSEFNPFELQSRRQQIPLTAENIEILKAFVNN